VIVKIGSLLVFNTSVRQGPPLTSGCLCGFRFLAGPGLDPIHILIQISHPPLNELPVGFCTAQGLIKVAVQIFLNNAAVAAGGKPTRMAAT